MLCERHPQRPAAFVLRLRGCGCAFHYCGPCKQDFTRMHNQVAAANAWWYCQKCGRHNIGQPTESVTRL